jgi:hypothetical protein
MPNTVRQGATYDFNVDLDGSDESGFTVNIAVMQFPGDTPSISREITYIGKSFKGSLTSAETAALAIGRWYIHTRASDTDEDLREPIPLDISKGWI